MFSDKTNHPLWRIVRKSVAQAFAVNNMRWHSSGSPSVMPCIECIAADGIPCLQCT